MSIFQKDMTKLTDDYKTLVDVDQPEFKYQRNKIGDYSTIGMILTNEEVEERRRKTEKLP